MKILRAPLLLDAKADSGDEEATRATRSGLLHVAVPVAGKSIIV